MNRVAIGRCVFLAVAAMVTAGWLAAIWLAPWAAPWTPPPERQVQVARGHFASPTRQVAPSHYDFRTDQDQWLALVCEPTDFRTGRGLDQYCLRNEAQADFAGRAVTIRYFRTEWRTVLGPRPDLVLLDVEADGAPLIARSERVAWIQARARKAATSYPLLWGFVAALGGWLATPWVLERSGPGRPARSAGDEVAQGFGRRRKSLGR